MNEHDEALRKQTAFLGQPKGVGTLSFMQLCNSFANYAMSAVLIYYLCPLPPLLLFLYSHRSVPVRKRSLSEVS